MVVVANGAELREVLPMNMFRLFELEREKLLQLLLLRLLLSLAIKAQAEFHQGMIALFLVSSEFDS